MRRGFTATLSPFLDSTDGLWRMKGRTFSASFLSYDERCPVILPRCHPVTTLIVRHFHILGHHELIDRSLNEMRRWYVVEKPRALLNAEVKKCPACILRKARPSAPQMAGLPPCRLAVGQRPFTHCGMDAFGPFSISRLRRKEKWYGLMFVCQTTRAVYIELMESLSGQSCMRAMDSMVVRRGPPSMYYMDNGTNFVYASKRYRSITGDKPEFVFNPPGAPHMGGSWERMIGLTKRALTAMGMESPISEERLRHLMIHAEYLINTRPLTEIPYDPRDNAAITPMSILLGYPGHQGETSVLEMSQARDESVQEFWRRWSQEYLRTIAHRSKWRGEVEPLQVGDLVYVCDTDYRSGWSRGRITHVFEDPLSKQVRRAKVEMREGKLKKVVLRPATRLARIQIVNSEVLEVIPLGHQKRSVVRIAFEIGGNCRDGE